MTIGERIAKKRREKQWTQQRLAEEMGLNIRSIRDWESGATKPALSTIIKLCSLLDVSSDYLLGIDNRDPLYLDDFSENDQILIRAALQTMKNVRNSSI